MHRGRSDRYWRTLRDDQLHWAVLTHDRYRGTPTGDDAEAFARSGEDHTELFVMPNADAVAGGRVAHGSALDFGCGVGRVTIPLARRFDRVVGVDVSPPMRTAAARAAENAGLTNVEIVGSLDGLPDGFADGSFDLVHTLMVLQHIPPARGLALIEQLLACVAPGGVAMLHVPFSDEMARTRRGRLRRALWRASTLVRDRMQMHAYPMSAIVERVMDAGLDAPTLRWGHNPGYPSVIVLAKRPPE